MIIIWGGFMKKSSIIVAAMVVGVLSALFHLPQPYFSSSFYSDIVSVYHDIYPDTDRSRWYGESYLAWRTPVLV